MSRTKSWHIAIGSACDRLLTTNAHTNESQFGTFAKVDFFVAVGFVKLSITSFNMRLTGLSSKRWMYAHWAFFGVLVIYILTSILLITFQCNPVVAGWDSVATGRLETPPKCLSELAVGNPLSIWHVVMDFCLLAVPILVLWKIKIPFNVKFRLLGLFSIGAVCCFCSVMRQVAQSRLKFDPTCKHPSCSSYRVVTWSSETCAKLSAARQLYRHRILEPRGYDDKHHCSLTPDTQHRCSRLRACIPQSFQTFRLLLIP